MTTMWDKTKNKDIAESRVSQLEKNFWEPLINTGARHKRFEENSSTCAWGIIQDLMGEGKALLLQEELVDAARQLNETTAGQTRYTQFQKLQHEQRETIKQLQAEAKTQKDLELLKQLEAELTALRSRVAEDMG